MREISIVAIWHEITGKVALITGASCGIGLAIATLLAAQGADIIAFDLPGSSFDTLEAEVAAQGRRLVPIFGDVTKGDDWRSAVAAGVSTFGRIDILVNNAGVEGYIGKIADYPEEIFDQVMSVNTRGVFLGMKYLIPELLKVQGSKSTGYEFLSSPHHHAKSLFRLLVLLPLL